MKLEKLLGRRVAPDERGSIPSLDAVPDALLEEVRAVASRSRMGGVEILQFYVVESDLDHVAAFLDDVVHGSRDPEGWGRFDVLCGPSVALSDALQTSVESILSGLAPVEGDRWWRVEPSLEDWNASGSAGAPSVLIKQVPYYWTATSSTEWIRLTDERLEPIVDLDVAVRRWVASRIAWEIDPSGDGSGIGTVGRICAALQLDENRLSVDGRSSMEGLAREMSELSPDPRGVPGHRGPDVWYRPGKASAVST